MSSADLHFTPPLALGIDLGTTTISAALVDLHARRQLEARTLPNTAERSHPERFRHEQDANIIWEQAEQLLHTLLNAYPSVCAIGLTGQMHGIVYVNAAGHAVSPLYTWQDTRGDEPFAPGLTHCDEICRRTGRMIRPGYGLVTHFYNVRHGLVPPEAVSFCTIMDYVAMRITGNAHPLMHPSNAASLGLFDPETNAFCPEAIEALELTTPSCPRIASDGPIGYCEGIPVTVAIGDNQASFFGAVRNEESEVLVNYGTGSQISFIEPECAQALPAGLEKRPYHSGKHLLVGPALCGGRAYALLERFFRQYLAACGQDAGSQYSIMNALAQEALEAGEVLPVRTTFCGTREDPTLRGEISALGEDNFTPRALILGVLQGMADELRALLPQSAAFAQLVASGNAVQKNPTFQQVLSRTFQLPLRLSAAREEAAFGAALYAALFGSRKLTLADVKACIP